jgi:hypothetical protein
LTGPQGPVGPQGPAGAPVVTSVVAPQPWNSITDNLWHPVPFLSLTLPLVNAGPVAIAWSVAVPMNGAIVTRLCIDGKVITSTNMVVGNTTYASSTGVYYETLAGGTHTITLQYRTNMAFTFDPTADWQSTRLQAMTWDH